VVGPAWERVLLAYFFSSLQLDAEIEEGAVPSIVHQIGGWVWPGQGTAEVGPALDILGVAGTRGSSRPGGEGGGVDAPGAGARQTRKQVGRGNSSRPAREGIGSCVPRTHRKDPFT
jgi:hypothetical protein